MAATNRCNCENIGAGCAVLHEAGACQREGTVRYQYVGLVCGQCSSFMLDAYKSPDERDAELEAALATRRRQPEPWVDTNEDGDVRTVWTFPRGMRDADIRLEVNRQGYSIGDYHHLCESGCCGRRFHRGLRITQGRAAKRAEIYSSYCC